MNFLIEKFNFFQIRSTLNKSPVYDPFTKSSFFWVTLSMILEIVDIASDIAVAVKLHQEKNTEWWFRLTLILILVPLVLVNLFSIFWHHQVRNLRIYFNIMILVQSA